MCSESAKEDDTQGTGDLVSVVWARIHVLKRGMLPPESADTSVLQL